MANSNQDYTLAALLASLDTGLQKSAAEAEEDGKDKGSEDDKQEKKENPFAAKKDKEDKSEKDESEKGDKEDEDEEDASKQTKEASLAGAALAREIMEKVASLQLNTPNTNTGMNKQAQAAGQTLAQALLEKLASAGDVNTADGIAPGAVPSKTQADLAQDAAESDATVKPMPTSDGLRPQGSMNEIFDAMVQDALAAGAAGEEQVHNTGMSGAEGVIEDRTVPNQVKTAEAIEKAAAVSALVQDGYDFADAVEMIKQAEASLQADMEKAAALNALIEDGVDFEDALGVIKQAEAELAAEHDTLVKAAALEELLGQGVDFDDAVEMIKSASAGDVNTVDGIAPGAVPSKTQADLAQDAAESDATVKPMPTSDGLRPQGTMNEIFDAMVQDALAAGAAGEEQVHSSGISQEEGMIEERTVPNQVKMAKVNELVQNGIDYDYAVEIVKQASDSLLKQAGTAVKVIDNMDRLRRMGHQFVKGVKDNAARAGNDFRHARNRAGVVVDSAGNAVTRGQSLKNLAKNPLVAGGAAAGLTGASGAAYLANREKKASLLRLAGPAAKVADAAKPLVTRDAARKVALGLGAAGAVAGGAAGAAGGYALAHKKQAAVNQLIERGIDFDTAVDMVNQKSLEMYGA